LATDYVNEPPHYTRWKIQPADFIRANNLSWEVGNVIKYVMRYDAKNGLQDLMKAQRNLEWLMDDLRSQFVNESPWRVGDEDMIIAERTLYETWG
jgi:hypothetical protein